MRSNIDLSDVNVVIYTPDFMREDPTDDTYEPLFEDDDRQYSGLLDDE